MTEQQILKIKKKNMTAIPVGTYPLLMNVVSPKYSKKQYYMDVCGGKVPRLDGIKCWSGVLIHCGNDQNDTAGCLLVGKNLVKGKVLYSRQCFEQLYPILKAAYNRGENITITITRTY